MKRTIPGDIRKLQLMSITLFGVLALSLLCILQFNNAIYFQKSRIHALSEILQARLIRQNVDLNKTSFQELQSQIKPIVLDTLSCYDNTFVGGFYSKRFDRVVVGSSNDSTVDVKGKRLAPGDSGRRSWSTGRPQFKIFWSPIQKYWILKCDNPVVQNGKVVGHTFANVAIRSIVLSCLRLGIGTVIALVICIILTPLLTRRFLGRIDRNVNALSSLSKEASAPPQFDYDSFTEVARKISESYTALRNSYRYQESLLDNFPWGYAIVDAEGRFIKLNLNGQEILSLSTKQLSDIMVERRAQNNSPLLRALKEKIRVDADMVLPIVSPSKTIRVTAFPTVLPDGSDGAMAWFVDVSETVNAHRTVELATKQKAEMLDSCPWGYLISDENGVCIEVNEEGARSLGSSRDEIVGTELLSWSDNGTSPLTRALKEQVTVSGEFINPTADAETKIFNVYSFPITLESGRTGAMAWFTDITEQRQMQLKVQHMDRLSTIGEMISIVAHDIRNPLTAIKMKAQLAVMMPDKVKHVDEWHKIDGFVDNINQYLDRVLSYCKPSNSSLVSCSVKELYDNVVTILSSKMRHSNIKLTVEIDTPEPIVKVNPLEFQHIILNLINNAIEAITDAGEIIFSCANEDDCVKIHLRDSGCGIAEEDIPKIWRMYYTTKPSGNGIGLAMAKKVIEQSGGSISVVSRLGEGTCFTITLPRTVNGYLTA